MCTLHEPSGLIVWGKAVGITFPHGRLTDSDDVWMPQELLPHSLTVLQYCFQLSGKICNILANCRRIIYYTFHPFHFITKVTTGQKLWNSWFTSTLGMFVLMKTLRLLTKCKVPVWIMLGKTDERLLNWRRQWFVYGLLVRRSRLWELRWTEPCRWSSWQTVDLLCTSMILDK